MLLPSNAFLLILVIGSTVTQCKTATATQEPTLVPSGTKTTRLVGWLYMIHDTLTSQSEATLKIRVSGEAKKSFEVPINKADSRFFKFAFRGDETGEEQVLLIF